MKAKVLSGIVKRHPDGFGFFIPDDSEFPDVFIPPRSMFGVMTNDKVVVQVTQERGRDRYSGDIIRIHERATVQVLGRYIEMNGEGLLLDTSHMWGSSLKIPNNKSMGAQKGSLVLAKVTSYPAENSHFEGEVIQVIGDADDPAHDTQRVIIEHQIPNTFSKQVEKELESIPDVVREEDKVGRKDFTEKSFITIDGMTAKDFDDAIYVETANNGFKIWVAIADVSHYIKPDTAIDDEAYKRGTSSYFPNFVVPMLPEKISNGLCSLNPDVERLAMVAEIHLDFQGEILSSTFCEGVIKSAARVTYGQAQDVLDGEPVESIDHVKDMILIAKDVAKILMNKRFKDGSLDLEIPETQVIVDEAGYAIDIQRSERLFSHRLIEEFMLIANVAVARYLKNKETPGLHRIHEPPESSNIGQLNRYITNFGGTPDTGGKKLQKRISKALEQFKGTQFESILSILTLRTMKQAKYSADPIGHFGLGFEDYAHFTSPIRRYPDLIIHRQLKSLILKSDEYKALKVGDLDSAGVHLSACEQRSVKAERQLYSIKKARLMENAIGQEFEGTISSVAKFGIFVLLRDFEVDGLVALDRLGHDHFFFDEDTLSLIGKRTGVTYKIGDRVQVRVVSADTDLGRIDFELLGVEQRGDSNNRKTARKEPKKRGKTKGNRSRSRKSRVSRRSRKG